MSDKTNKDRQSPKLLQGDAVPMPNYQYQTVSGLSGSISAKKGAQPVRRFEELGNFVLGN